jgi:hypothetical protein
MNSERSVGLSLVTVFTLIVIPVCYSLMMPDLHVPIHRGGES